VTARDNSVKPSARTALATLGTGALLLKRSDALRFLADIDAELAARHARDEAGGADCFTSNDLPPGVSRRAFRELVNASGLGTKSGQVWSISKADWFALRRAPPKQRATEIEANGEAIASAVGAANDVDAMLAGAGLRASRAVTPRSERSVSVTAPSRGVTRSSSHVTSHAPAKERSA
jgi:hypothetical protein